MTLDMYLGEHLVDSIPLPSSFSKRKSEVYIQTLIERLEKKHADLLSGAGVKPVYYITGVQSGINGFVPLRHPGR